jgi:hypothetical protein
MTVDVEHPLAWEYLQIVIDEFEKGALKSGDREGVLVVTNNPLECASMILDVTKNNVNNMREVRKAFNPANGEEEKKSPLQLIQEGGSVIEADADLLELFGGPDNPVQNYVEDCLNCSLRLKFDWQLKPLALLAPIEAFLDTLNASLDKLKRRMDPFKLLGDICEALNMLKGFCPPDLILLLMALKLLLKRYLLGMLKIRIDWTLLLGPILKFIVEALTSLLEEILGIILAPLDCALNALRTVRSLILETKDFIHTAKAFGSGVGNVFEDLKSGKIPGTVDGGFTVRDIQWIPGAKKKRDDGLQHTRLIPPEGGGPPDPGWLRSDDRLANTTGEDSASKDVHERGRKKNENADFSYPTGFELRSDLRLDEALKDPAFSKATFVDKLIVSVQDAKLWLEELFENLMLSLRSLNALVGGALELNFDTLGILLFLIDLIGVVFMIIRMLRLNPNIKDWCTFLQDNPELVEQHLRGPFGEGITSEARGSGDTAELILKRGPDIVGTIKTCAAQRSTLDQQILQQWVTDLEDKGTI